MRKVQLTLTDQEVKILDVEAGQLGYNLTKYIKFLLAKQIIDFFTETKIPVFRMSRKAELTAQKAIQEYRQGKTVKLNSLDDLDEI